MNNMVIPSCFIQLWAPQGLQPPFLVGAQPSEGIYFENLTAFNCLDAEFNSLINSSGISGHLFIFPSKDSRKFVALVASLDRVCLEEVVA